MTRLTERVRCIACTHYTTEIDHVEGCQHKACPQRIRFVRELPPEFADAVRIQMIAFGRCVVIVHPDHPPILLQAGA